VDPARRADQERVLAAELTELVAAPAPQRAGGAIVGAAVASADRDAGGALGALDGVGVERARPVGAGARGVAVAALAVELLAAAADLAADVDGAEVVGADRDLDERAGVDLLG